MKVALPGLFLSLVAVGCRCSKGSAPAVDTVRIGTYHAPSLVIAWVRSAEHEQELDLLLAARDAALAAGDSAKAADCERRGAEGQDLAHRQLAGEADVLDILARLEEHLPAIRAEAGVERIAAEGEVLGDRVVRVDLTDLLTERFHPDEATRKLLLEVRKHPKGVRVH